MRNKLFGILAVGLVLLSGNALAFENVIPLEAYDMVAAGEAFILDVRTPQEWLWVGHPGENKQGDGADLEGFVLNVSYQVYHKKKHLKTGGLVENRRFVKDVKKRVSYDTAVITMCRSGGRSLGAAVALEDAGFTHVYNMVTGFEGKSDSSGYSTVNGWKADGLPYNYAEAGMFKD